MNGGARKGGGACDETTYCWAWNSAQALYCISYGPFARGPLPLADLDAGGGSNLKDVANRPFFADRVLKTPPDPHLVPLHLDPQCMEQENVAILGDPYQSL